MRPSPHKAETRPLSMASRPVTLDQVRGTIRLITYYRRFLRSSFAACVNPEGTRYGAEPLTKAQAEARLHYLLDVATNRRAGMPDQPHGRNHDPDQWWRMVRDQRAVHDRIRSRVVVRQFETRACRERFADLLTTREDR